MPGPRGPLSQALLEALVGARPTDSLPLPPADVDPYGEDLQLALHLSYELHYRSLPGVDDALEWDLDLLRLRSRLERPFLDALRRDTSGSDDVEAALAPLLLEPVSGTGPSWHLAGRGRALAAARVRRPPVRLPPEGGRPAGVRRTAPGGQIKAALVSVQHDEYGAGRVERMHATLFAAMMRELDLDDRYGAHVDRAPAATLAPVNLMSLLGLRRALRGAAVGQFVMIEVTSSPGSRRLSSAFDRLSDGSAGQRFYDEHIEADAVHEQVLRAGLRDLLRREPQLAADVVLGIEAGLLLEDRFADHVLGAWSAGGSSLRRPL
jgi:hypothetical protein